MSRRGRHPLKDEQGDWSTSRISFVVTLVFTLALIAADTFGDVEMPGEAYALLGGLLTGLIAWAGGPRIARYVGPAIAGVAQGIGAAGRRVAGTDNRFRDDERG